MTLENCVVCGKQMIPELAFLAYWAIIAVLIFAAAALVGAFAFVCVAVWHRVGKDLGW